MSATSLSHPRAGMNQALVTLVIGVTVLVALFWPESRAAYRVWNESTAYGHCFLVVPIAVYLLWDRRGTLHGLVPQPDPRLALLALPLPFVWLAAERLGIMEVRQFAGIAALEVLFLTVLGWRAFRAVSGPLLYLVFLVPFGAFLTPALQSVTAWFIEVGLTILDIPHFITDMTVEIAGGTFYVAEACAGLRFLIASVAFGVFFALLNYTSPRRRAGFIAASILVPIVANGIRALGIVVLGYFLGDAQAAAADHLIYGWVFFSFVTLMLVAAGLPFREPPAEATAAGSGGVPLGRGLSAYGGGASFVLLLIAAGPAVAMALQRSAPAHLDATPEFVAPEGCSIAPPTADGPGALTWAMTCMGRAWTITVQRLPSASTAFTLIETRDRLIGELDAEEATITPLQGAPGWRSVTNAKPLVVAATAAWVDGRPATGGIGQRVTLARNSLVGASHDPAVMAVVYRSDATANRPAIDAAQAELVRFLKAQPALGTELARITATSSPPPRS